MDGSFTHVFWTFLPMSICLGSSIVLSILTVGVIRRCILPSVQPLGHKPEPKAESEISWKASTLMEKTDLCYNTSWRSFDLKYLDTYCNWRTGLGSVNVSKSGSHLYGNISLSLWQSEGTLLATGSYDGFARIWTKDGEMALIDVTFTLINVV